MTNEEIIEALKEMTLLQASELVKMIEETFGVSAAAPAAVVAAARPEGSQGCCRGCAERHRRGCQQGQGCRAQGEARGCRRCCHHQVVQALYGFSQIPAACAAGIFLPEKLRLLQGNVRMLCHACKGHASECRVLVPRMPPVCFHA